MSPALDNCRALIWALRYAEKGLRVALPEWGWVDAAPHIVASAHAPDLVEGYTRAQRLGAEPQILAACGPASDLFAVFIDAGSYIRADEIWEQGAAEFGPPAADTALNFGAGVIRLFRWPEGWRGDFNGLHTRLPPGWWPLGEGAFAPLPPSEGVSWRAKDPIGPAPHWLLAMLRDERSKFDWNACAADAPLKIKRPKAWAKRALAAAARKVRKAKLEPERALNNAAFGLGPTVEAGLLSLERQVVPSLAPAARFAGLRGERRARRIIRDAVRRGAVEGQRIEVQ